MGIRRAHEFGNGGFVLLDLIGAMLVLALTAAGAAAAISTAFNTRVRAERTDAATAVAADVLNRAEALGCGLPPRRYGDVTEAQRLATCRYTASTGGSSLADADFEIERGGHSFDVRLRMSWHLLEQPPADFLPALHICERRARYADRRRNPDAEVPVDMSVLPRQPTLLARDVTVTPADGRSVSLAATDALLPNLTLAAADVSLVLYGGSHDEMQIRWTSGGTRYHYPLHGDRDGCFWFPWLSHNDPTLVFIDNSGSSPRETALSATNRMCPATLPSGWSCYRYTT